MDKFDVIRINKTENDFTCLSLSSYQNEQKARAYLSLKIRMILLDKVVDHLFSIATKIWC